MTQLSSTRARRDLWLIDAYRRAASYEAFIHIVGSIFIHIWRVADGLIVEH